MKWMIRKVEYQTALGNDSEIRVIQLISSHNLFPSDTIWCHIHIFFLLVEMNEFQREFSLKVCVYLFFPLNKLFFFNKRFETRAPYNPGIRKMCFDLKGSVMVY
jgi:hypothetical protein